MSGDRSKTHHAVIKPGDLGDKVPALCGKRPNTKTGWVERKDFNSTVIKCGRCCRLLIDAIGL